MQCAHGGNQAHSALVQQKFAPVLPQRCNIMEDLCQIVDSESAAARCGRRQTADAIPDAIGAGRGSQDRRKASR